MRLEGESMCILHSAKRRAVSPKIKGNTDALVGVTHRVTTAAANSLPLPELFPARPWHAEICSLYRRICILRARGHVAEADKLTTDDWPRLLAEVRQAVPDADHALAPLLSAEAERITTAEAVAELLDLRGPTAPSTLASAVTPVARSTSSAAPAPRTTPASSSAPKGIADFIDEMFGAEQARGAPPGRR
jgi:hypothetical protein